MDTKPSVRWKLFSLRVAAQLMIDPLLELRAVKVVGEDLAFAKQSLNLGVWCNRRVLNFL